MRGSSPSGSTTCRAAALARSMSWCSNISGVTTLPGVTSRRSSSTVPSTCLSNRSSAVSILRAAVEVSRVITAASRSVVAMVPWSQPTTGTCTSRPWTRRWIGSGSGKPPFRTMPAGLGKVLARCASSSPSRTSVRSAGTIAVHPSKSRSSTLGRVIAATSRPGDSRSSRSSSPNTSSPPTAPISSRTVGESSTDGSGNGVRRRMSRRVGLLAERTESRQGLLQQLRLHPVGHDCQDRGVVGASLVGRHVGGDLHLVRCALVAGDHQDHRRVEVGGDPRVVGELRRGARRRCSPSR